MQISLRELNVKLALFIREVVFTNQGSRFRQNFLRVAKANVLAQLLSILFAPVLSRLYSPSDYGVLAVFTASLSVMSAFATLRLEWSIPNASSRTQAAALLVWGLVVLLPTSVCASLLLYGLLEVEVAAWRGVDALAPFVALLPLAIIGTGLHQLMQGWYIRQGNLAPVSRSKIAQSISATAVSVGGGVASLGALGLIASSLASAWIGIGMLLRQAEGLRKAISRVTRKRLKSSLRQFGRESCLSASVSVVNAASLVAVPMLLAYYYSPKEVGWYALMSRLAIAPARLFTTAIGQSFWSEAAKLVKSDVGALRNLFVRTTRRLCMLALPLMVVCLCGPWYVGWVFGAHWERAGNVLAALVPLLFGQIVVSPLSHLIVHRKQHWQLVWDLVRLMAIVGIVTVCALAGAEIVSTVLSASLVMFVMYVVLFFMNLRCLVVGNGNSRTHCREDVTRQVP